MADPVTWGIIISTSISALSAVQAGRAAEAEAEGRAAELDMQRKQNDMKTGQEEVAALKSAREARSTNLAIGGTLGFDPLDNMSWLALDRTNQSDTAIDVANISLMGDLTGDALRRTSQSTRTAGKIRKTQGYLNAANTVFTSGVNYYKTG